MINFTKMEKMITGNDLKALGFKEGKILGMVLDLAGKQVEVEKDELLQLFAKLYDYPEEFLPCKIVVVLNFGE